MWIVESFVDPRDRQSALGRRLLNGMDAGDAQRATTQAVCRIKKIGDGTWVFAPWSWLEEAGAEPTIGRVVEIHDGETGQTYDRETLDISLMIKQREQRLMKEAIAMRDEYERRAIEAEQRVRELELDLRVREFGWNSVAGLARELGDGAILLTASEVRVFSRLRPGLRAATWNQIFDQVTNELADDKEGAKALLAKLTLLGFSGA